MGLYSWPTVFCLPVMVPPEVGTITQITGKYNHPVCINRHVNHSEIDKNMEQ